MAYSNSTIPDKLSSSVIEVLNAKAEIQQLDSNSGANAEVHQAYIDNTLNTGHPCYLKVWCGPYGTGTNQVNKTSTDGTGLIVGGATAAVATIVCHADIATDDSITLVSADGTSKTYVAKTANTWASNYFAANGDAADTADALRGAILDSDGHSSKFTIVRSDATLTITNATKGTAGNTTITNNFNAAATVTSFAGGTDDSQLPSGTQEPDFIFYCPAGSTAEYVFPQGCGYTEELRACVVTTPGKAGSTPMTNQVLFRITKLDHV